MFEIIIVVLIFLLIPVYVIFRWSMVKLKRKILFEKKFPEKWKEILASNVEMYNKLPDKMKKELHGLINIFIAEKNFEGCKGLKINDEIRITVAGQACILLLNKNLLSLYPRLHRILIYPSAYFAEARDKDGVMRKSLRAGESWGDGKVVLAWDHVLRGAKNIKDGQNVVLHEFAHQLDQEDGSSNGAPILDKRESYTTWAEVFEDEYKRLQVCYKKHVKSIMDYYGATNPAEFFAVATETFFEKSEKLYQKHPELYEELKNYYKIDPLNLEIAESNVKKS